MPYFRCLCYFLVIVQQDTGNRRIRRILLAVFRFVFRQYVGTQRTFISVGLDPQIGSSLYFIYYKVSQWINNIDVPNETYWTNKERQL